MIRTTAVVSLLLLRLSSPLFAATDRPLKSFPAADLKEPAAGADLLFVVSGDNRPTAQGAPLPPVLKTILSEIGLIRPDLVIWTGDTVYGYCDSRDELEQEYKAFAAAALRVGGMPLFNAPGNHEIHAQQTCSAPPDKVCGVPCSEDVFRSHFGQLYGSVDIGGAHFIALDSEVPGEEGAITGDQLAWLKNDLEANKTARAIFLFSHTEFYSAPRIDPSAAKDHPAVANRSELQDLFRRYPVKAVFSGHEHIYYRAPAEEHDGIDYFVAGGAGAPLYASPDRGGFSHYLVVRLSGSKVTYDVVEPGRLSLEHVLAEAGSSSEVKFWVVNSNDIDQPLPLRGINRFVPASLGSCDSLAVTAAAKKRDAWVTVDGVSIDSCVPDSGSLHLHFKVPPMPQGSMLVTLIPPRPAPATISAEQATEIVEKLPEIKAWSAYIKRTTHGKVTSALMVMPEEPETVEGKRLRYWSVGFYENQPDHYHRWDTFLVRVDGKEILVEDLSGDPITLKQWRKEEKPMDRVKP